MARHPPTRRRTAPDLISQLPEDVKHRILECLDAREAAKTALLSTLWNEVWLRHGRLVFDWDSLAEGRGLKRSKMIYSALLLRSAPVKIFTLYIVHWEPSLQQSDLDLWCGFLSRNGIEQLSLDVHITQGDNRSLPVCIIYCPTIKQLVLNGVDFCLPVNPRPGSIFSGVTSLMFYHLNFDRGDSPTVIHLIPYLEVLVFLDCHCIDSFVINAPRLKNLTFIDYKNVSEWKWFELHFCVIKTLCFSARTGMEYDNTAATNPTIEVQERLPIAKNIEVIELQDFSFNDVYCFTLVIHLLRKCQKLRKLEIDMIMLQLSLNGGADPSILRDPDGWFSDQDLRELRTVKMKAFRGSTQEMLFIRLILSKSPSLEEVLISESCSIDTSVALKVPREMISYPRASPKAKVVFLDPCRYS